MDLEINKPGGPPVTLTPETPVSKLSLDLYLGQAMRVQVISAVNNNQVMLNINGQNVSAKTSHSFTPGEMLDVEVLNTEDELVLQVQQKAQSTPGFEKTILQNALLQTLPKQAPPTNLLDSLDQLVQSGKLPEPLNQQVKNLLSSITPLAQLQQQLPKAIVQSGVFLESALLAWKPGMPRDQVQADIKGQYLKVLDSLPEDIKNSPVSTANQDSNPAIKRDTLPLPGAVPQPLPKNDAAVHLLDKPVEAIQSAIHDQVSQALSRITASQINHLSTDESVNKNGFLIMLDLPIKTTAKDIDVVPLMIKQRKATTTQPAQWSISFAVSLSELGDMQATVSLNGNDVNVSINADKPQAINTLLDNQGEMSTLLQELGLNLHDFYIRQGLENNQINAEDLHLLDIRI